ncbi:MULTISPECIES: hypothetical protein [Micromonospora]|uniref:hypothetical protein n=1 Tax=Micromonospora TaxID=1873 RepID=UPI0004C248D1|nr:MULTISPECIES: hypothetical protein [Micromonospora]
MGIKPSPDTPPESPINTAERIAPAPTSREGANRTTWIKHYAARALACWATFRAEHRMCLCMAPLCSDADSQGRPYGLCVGCGHRRQFGATAALLARMRMLTAIPAGQRDPATYARVCDMARAEREAKHG